MNDCQRPLDENEVEALASGSPAGRSDAAAHAAVCPRCGAAVHAARALDALLEGSEPAEAVEPAALADRVLRVRPFSRRERTSFAVWGAPLLLLSALTVSGLALVAGGVPAAGEGAGLGAAGVTAAAALARAGARWTADFVATAPAGLAGLSEILRGTAAGWSALLLLVPAAFGLRRALARAAARR